MLVMDPEVVREHGFPKAALLSQIRYWLNTAAGGQSRFVVERGGHRWVARSREQLADETGMSLKQVERTLQKLDEEGLIIRERHLFENKVTPHIRGTSPPTLGASDSPNSGAMILYETDSEINMSGHVSDETISPLDSRGAVSREDKVKRKTGLKVSDVLAGASTTTPPESKGLDKASKAQDLFAIFRDAMTAEYPDFFLPSPTQKQLGQFNLFAKRCPPGKAGRIIDHCVRDWDGFLSKAINEEGAIKPPDVPNIKTLLLFVQSAVNLYLEHAAEASEKPSKGTQNKPGYARTPKSQTRSTGPTEAEKVKPKPKKGDPDYVPSTYDEVYEILYGDDDDDE